VKKTEVIFVAVGLGLFAFVASKIGWRSVVDQLRAAWPAIPALVGLGFLRLLLQTRSWQIALRSEGITASSSELMGIRLASQSMGYLSVLGPALSEPMKISLLRSNFNASATATLVDTGVYWFTSALLGITGCASAALVLAGRQNTLTLLAICLLFAVSLSLLVRQRALLPQLVSHLGNRAPSWLRKGANLETEIRSFRTRHPEAVQTMTLIAVACQVLIVGETTVVFSFLNLPTHISTVLGIESALRMVKMVGGWLPARIGADESGAAAAFVAFGFTPAAGLVLALVRRFRDLLWCAWGLGWLAWRSRSNRREEQPQGELLVCKQF
jgi:hypothetical protein